eukprot:TRINITY_DN9247_c0_g5_i1.p1 TRINITY_DN9247_c0_g5~~TRINITY_DN9247_c0_g5_i1.p1  ORF type:complete len:792 (-),score=169.10 TRINITY_DN9247_c0_g5_i1:182-2557(-)
MVPSSLLLLCALGLTAALPLNAPSDRLKLDLDSSTGSYSVMVDGALWFGSGPTGFTIGHDTKSTKDGLKPGPASQQTGEDVLGSFSSTTLEYTSGATSFLTTFKQYAQRADGSAAIVFEQRFPNGASDTSPNGTDPYAARDQVSSMFPSLVPSNGLGYLAFAGDMTGSHYVHDTDMSKIPSGVTGTGPVCMFPQNLSAAVVLSSFSQFMAASSAHVDSSLAYGVQGSVTEFPAEYSVSFVLSLAPRGAGVNAAFEAWGDLLLSKYGKSRVNTYSDYGLKHLSYSTDNGAYYYYQTEDHAAGHRGPPYTPGKTYQDTLIDVKNYAVSEQIPYKYILLDSWWYYQGKGSGVSNWVGRPDVFPDGNAYLRNVTGWPIMGHNRYWAVDNVYAKQNGGQYEFVVEKKGDGAGFNDYAWPTEQRFWDDLMYNSSKWGLFMYEQDWLDTEYDNMRHLNFDATAARTWLLQMGSAAERNGLTIQYCMSHCRHILQSVEIPAVTNARASGDYHPGNDQWQPLGNTGIFAWAVAIAPTKDNYWSTDVQTGSSYGDYDSIKESYNRLQAAVSTLSKGPVAPSDKIGRSDALLISRSCAADGTLLQGDKPAMAIDSQHVQAAFKCDGCGPQGELWATYSALGQGSAGHAVLLGANLKQDYTVKLSELELRPGVAQWVAYEVNTTDKVSVATSGIDFKACGKWDFQVFALAAVDQASGLAFLGEVAKWVPVSGARFSDLQFSHGAGSSTASVLAKGTVGEKITFSWAQAGTEAEVVSKDCVFPDSGSILVRAFKNATFFGCECE